MKKRKKNRSFKDYTNHAGQLIYKKTEGLFSHGANIPEELVKDAIDEWFSYHASIGSSTIKSIDIMKSPKYIPVNGHQFMQLVMEISDEIHCTAIRSFSNDRNGVIYWYLVCDFSAAPVIGQPIYRVAAKTAGDGCKKFCKKHKKFNALCCDNEEYYDKFYFKRIQSPPKPASARRTSLSVTTRLNKNFNLFLCKYLKMQFNCKLLIAS